MIQKAFKWLIESTQEQRDVFTGLEKQDPVECSPLSSLVGMISSASLEVRSGETLGGFIMKQPKMNDLVIDHKGTKRMRADLSKAKKIKITINIDQDSLESLKELSGKTGAPYQKLLNQILKEGLSKRDVSESRLERIEKELERLRKKIAA